MNTYYTTRDFEFLRNRPVVLEGEAQAEIDKLKTALREAKATIAHLEESLSGYEGAFEEVKRLEVENAALKAQVALLADPSSVHVNILRGALPLTKAQAIHIAGLPADIEEKLAAAKAGWDSAIADLRKAAEICRGVEKHRDSWRRVAEKLETAVVAANERIADLEQAGRYNSDYAKQRIESLERENKGLKSSMDGN